MSKKQPLVHCVFSPSEQSLSSLLEDSFRLYLRQMLNQTTYDTV